MRGLVGLFHLRYRRRKVTTKEHQQITRYILDLLNRDPVTLRRAPPGEGIWNVVAERQAALYEILGLQAEGQKLIDELINSGEGVIIPPGQYSFTAAFMVGSVEEEDK